VQVFRVTGALFFGAAERFRETLAQVSRRPRVLILRLDAVPAIDSTGLRVLDEIAERAAHDGTRLLLTELQAQPARAIAQAAVGRRISADQIFARYEDAATAARAIVETPMSRAS
jgi:SulP family sulfate permease